MPVSSSSSLPSLLPAAAAASAARDDATGCSAAVRAAASAEVGPARLRRATTEGGSAPQPSPSSSSPSRLPRPASSLSRSLSSEPQPSSASSAAPAAPATALAGWTGTGATAAAALAAPLSDRAAESDPAEGAVTAALGASLTEGPVTAALGASETRASAGWDASAFDASSLPDSSWPQPSLSPSSSTSSGTLRSRSAVTDEAPLAFTVVPDRRGGAGGGGSGAAGAAMIEARLGRLERTAPVLLLALEEASESGGGTATVRPPCSDAAARASAGEVSECRGARCCCSDTGAGKGAQACPSSGGSTGFATTETLSSSSPTPKWSPLVWKEARPLAAGAPPCSGGGGARMPSPCPMPCPKLASPVSPEATSDAR